MFLSGNRCHSFAEEESTGGYGFVERGCCEDKKRKSRQSIDLKGHVENDGEELPLDSNRKQSVEDGVVSRSNGWRRPFVMHFRGVSPSVTKKKGMLHVVERDGDLLSHGVRWVDQDSTETVSGHVEFVAAFAPPRLWVVLGGHRSAGRHSHMHRVARGAVAALARTPWRVRPRSADELPPPSGHRHLQPAGSQAHVLLKWRLGSDRRKNKKVLGRGRAPESGGHSKKLRREWKSNRNREGRERPVHGLSRAWFPNWYAFARSFAGDCYVPLPQVNTVLYKKTSAGMSNDGLMSRSKSSSYMSMYVVVYSGYGPNASVNDAVGGTGGFGIWRF
ncbi:hypothetical protein B296_00005583 [Ensete ventricosum]|uniref:Uncharacterized protein n=1 Tax=Ensete ventricosum TaxID=4639 RepID=A0A426Y482_ENSVE|nr:hypothetical protein B296_00005583 [Ensete ventricosum]